MSEELKSYPNLQTVVRIAQTLPVSSSTCERSLSAMRRVKNYLRSTMQQDRFSALSVLNIESDITRNIDIAQLIEEFSYNSDVSRRMRLHGLGTVQRRVLYRPTHCGLLYKL